MRMWQFRSCAFPITSADPIHDCTSAAGSSVVWGLDVMSPDHTRLKSRQITPVVISKSLTTAIVAGEVTKRGCAREPIRGGDHEFQTEADGMHRASRSVAVPSRYRRSAIGGGAEDRAARTPDRVAAAATQGNSARTRANAKEDRESGGEGRSRAGALFGPAAHGYQGPATAASAGKGEGDAGRLRRRGNGVAPTQHGQRHWNGVRDNPVSVFTALQRARISRHRAAEPNLAARRGQHRSLPEAFRVLRVGLPGRRQHI